MNRESAGAPNVNFRKISVRKIPCEQRLHFRSMSWRAKSSYFSHASSYRENVASARRVLTITFMLTVHTGKEVGKFRGNWLEQSVEDALVYEGNFNDQNSPKCIMDRVESLLIGGLNNLF